MSEETKAKRILVVEDEAIIAEDIRRTLRRLGYSVAGVAQTGQRAIELARESAPDLILMDIKLLGPLDGVQTTALILAEAAVPVVYLTGNSDDATLTRASDTAPYGYLLKPFDENDLRTTIEVARRKFEIETVRRERERELELTLQTIAETALDQDPKNGRAFHDAIARAVTPAGDEQLTAILSNIEVALSHLPDEAAQAQEIGGALADAYALVSQLSVARRSAHKPESMRDEPFKLV